MVLDSFFAIMNAIRKRIFLIMLLAPIIILKVCEKAGSPEFFWAYIKRKKVPEKNIIIDTVTQKFAVVYKNKVLGDPICSYR
jgi:hypothetical protein